MEERNMCMAMAKSLLGLALVLAASATFAGPGADQVPSDESNLLMRYTVVLLQEQHLHADDKSRFESFDASKYKFAKIKAKNGQVYYEVVLPKKGDPGQSYFVIFKEDSALMHVEPIMRGFTGNADQEIDTFKKYQGQVVDFGENDAN